MNVYLHRLATDVPAHSASQDDLAVLFGRWAQDPGAARVIHHIFRKTGIQRRHSVLPDFTEPGRSELFRTASSGQLAGAGTHARNQAYARHSAPMAVRVARKLLGTDGHFRPADVTHVITVSCTGFVNPGPDWAIVTELNLPGSVERYHLGFMGCYAALPALRMARQFCVAQPDAVVLVVCLELCSLHVQTQSNNDSILGNALFADGAAGALVSARRPALDQPAFILDGFHSARAPEGHSEMAWEIGDQGFNLVLSSYVPDVIAANLGRIVHDLLTTAGCDMPGIDQWAIHPGGRSILDKAEDSLRLRPAQLAASRSVLRDFGNMSSATLLFVLQKLLRDHTGTRCSIAAMAFGPGLTIECGLLRTVPASASAPVADGHSSLASGRTRPTSPVATV